MLPLKYKSFTIDKTAWYDIIEGKVLKQLKEQVMNNPLFLVLLTATGYGIWPLVSRLSGLSPIWIAITVSVGTAAVAVVGSPFSQEVRSRVKQLVSALEPA